MGEQAIQVMCPQLNCRTILSVPATARGKTVRCGNCGVRIKVPATAAVVDPAVHKAAASTQ